MGSEQGPVDRRRQHSVAMELFDRELDSLIYPVTKEGLHEATKNFLIRTFGYSAIAAETRVKIHDEQRDLPQAREIEDDQESLSEMLKIGLFDKLPEEYIILRGREEFDQWIGVFLQSVLLGHIEQSRTYEHINECPEDKLRFCPAKIIRCFVHDNLADQIPKIHESKAHNEGYLVYTDDLIYMNIKIVKELQVLGVYGEIEAKELLEEYRDWLESIGDLPFEYDQALFD